MSVFTAPVICNGSNSKSDSGSGSSCSSPSPVVARIQLGKPLLLPRAASAPLYISAILSFELFGAIPDSYLLSSCDLHACLETEGDADTGKGKIRCDFQHTVVKDNKAFFQLLPPVQSGVYSLQIWAESCPPGCYILPLILKPFEVCAVLPLRQHVSCVTFRPFPCLSYTTPPSGPLSGPLPLQSSGSICEEDDRSTDTSSPLMTTTTDGDGDDVNTWSCGIMIMEERGLTMGSHVWDSAVVVHHHLPTLLAALDLPLPTTHTHSHSRIKPHKSGLLGVELGSGVGLVGLALARTGLFSAVHLTDLPCQVPQTQANIDLNYRHCEQHPPRGTVTDTAAGGVKVTAEGLDWLSAASVATFQQYLTTTHATAGDPTSRPLIDVLIAADVLYSPELAEGFFNVVRALSTPLHTVLLLAQKIRGEQGRMLIDVSAIPGLSVSKLLEVCDVVVYKIVVVQ